MAVIIRAFVVAFVDILVTGRDMADIDQEWRELRAAPFVATGRQCLAFQLRKAP